MKLFLLLLLAGACSLAAAAQEPQETAPPAETATSSTDEPENPQLKRGHPLDPADVATLTGRSTQPQRRYAEPVVYLTIPGEYGNLWLDDAPMEPFFFGSTGRMHHRRLHMFGPSARTPRIFFPIFNGMFFVPR